MGGGNWNQRGGEFGGFTISRDIYSVRSALTR
jgi:hypothetical protein